MNTKIINSQACCTSPNSCSGLFTLFIVYFFRGNFSFSVKAKLYTIILEDKYDVSRKAESI